MADVWDDVPGETAGAIPSDVQLSNNSGPVRDSWDDDEEDEAAKKKKAEEEAAKQKEAEKKQQSTSTTASQSASKARKKALKEREEEDARKAAAEAAKASNAAAADPTKEKQKQQRMVEEADFSNAQQMYGDLSSAGELDKFIPKSGEDFLKFAAMLAERATHFSNDLHYTDFVKELLRLVSIPMRIDDLRLVTHSLNAVINDKIKEDRGAPSNASKKKQVAQVQKARARAIQQDEEEEAVEAGDVGHFKTPEDQYDFM